MHLGSLSFPRRLSKQLADFSKGTVSFHTRSVDGRDHIFFAPLVEYLSYVGERPQELASKYEAVGEELVQRWKDKNVPLQGPDRKAVGWGEDIFRNSWKGGSGRKETSVFEVLLNSWSLTETHRNHRRPRVGSDELKLLLKTRSSLNIETRPDRSHVDAEGLAGDNR